MRWNVVWWLLPDEAFPLVIAGCGLLVIVGLLRPRAAVGIIGGVLLLLLATPFVEAMRSLLPSWLLVVLGLVLAMAVVRGVAVMAIGPRAADHMIGSLAADVVRRVFCPLFMPIRLVFAMRAGGRR